jgi:hypothetical protein
MNHAVMIRFGQGSAHLAENMSNSSGWQRPIRLNESLQINAVQQLHHVIKRAVLGDAKVVELHRMR